MKTTLDEIVFQAERLQDSANGLIEAIDKIEDVGRRKELRRKIATIIADIEEEFVYKIRNCD